MALPGTRRLGGPPTNGRLPKPWGRGRHREGVGAGAGRGDAPNGVATAAAQRCRPPPRVSGAYGVVVDSIHGGVLAGAVVMVAGTNSRAFSLDSTGKFGSTASRPARTSSRCSIRCWTASGGDRDQPGGFPGGPVCVVAIGTPSASTLVASFCPPEKRITGNGTRSGRVDDADSDEPAAGGEGVVHVVQLEAGKGHWGAAHSRPARGDGRSEGTYIFVECRSRRKSGSCGRRRRRSRRPTCRSTSQRNGPGPDTARVQAGHGDARRRRRLWWRIPPRRGKKSGGGASGAAAPPPSRMVALRTGHATLTGDYNVAATGHPGGQTFHSVARRLKTTTDSTGHFALHNLPSGRRRSLHPQAWPYAETRRPSRSRRRTRRT